MKITYDPGVDALYIEVREGKPEDSLDIEEGATADMDAAGHIVGLELSDATERLGAESLASVSVSGCRSARQARGSERG